MVKCEYQKVVIDTQKYSIASFFFKCLVSYTYTGNITHNSNMTSHGILVGHAKYGFKGSLVATQ